MGIAGALTTIRTDPLPNKSLERCSYSSDLGTGYNISHSIKIFVEIPNIRYVDKEYVRHKKIKLSL